MATIDKLVIDASVLVAWFIPETQEQGSIARATITRFAAGAVELYAPAIMPAEVAAALVKATRQAGRKFTQKMAREALDHAEKIAFVLEGYPGTAREMMENAFRWQCGTYDGLYIDMARRLACPVTTVDRGMRQGCINAKVELFADA